MEEQKASTGGSGRPMQQGGDVGSGKHLCINPKTSFLPHAQYMKIVAATKAYRINYTMPQVQDKQQHYVMRFNIINIIIFIHLEHLNIYMHNKNIRCR